MTFAADLPNLAIAWTIQIAGVMSPGPAVALLLGVATARGQAPALRTCLGLASGAMVLAFLTVIGLAALLAEWHAAMVAVKLLGAAYLAWLAFGAFCRAAAPPPAPAGEVVPCSGAGDIASGFIFQLGNPKAIFFWIAVAAVGSLKTVSAPALAIFLVGAFAISFLGHGGWALLFASPPFRALYGRARRGIEGALGMIFAAASVKLLTTRS